MSYTLNQVELFALAESRRWSVTSNVRTECNVPMGVKFTSRDALKRLRDWTEFGISEGFAWCASTVANCLEGATLDELQLYCEIEEARAKIRLLEVRHVWGEIPFSDVQQARRDFKALLKKVEF